MLEGVCKTRLCCSCPWFVIASTFPSFRQRLDDGFSRGVRDRSDIKVVDVRLASGGMVAGGTNHVMPPSGGRVLLPVCMRVRACLPVMRADLASVRTFRFPIPRSPPHSTPLGQRRLPAGGLPQALGDRDESGGSSSARRFESSTATPTLVLS